VCRRRLLHRSPTGTRADQPGLACQHHQLRPVPGLQLGKNGATWVLAVAWPQHQPLGDLRVGQAAPHELEHLPLACGQPRQRRLLRRRAVDRPPGELGDEPPSHGGIEQGVRPGCSAATALQRRATRGDWCSGSARGLSECGVRSDRCRRRSGRRRLAADGHACTRWHCSAAFKGLCRRRRAAPRHPRWLSRSFRARGQHVALDVGNCLLMPGAPPRCSCGRPPTRRRGSTGSSTWSGRTSSASASATGSSVTWVWPA
jgi:hypothetical protein